MELLKGSANAVREMLFTEISRERAADFSQLRRVPSTNALKFLRYFKTLDVESADALCVALAQGAFEYLYPNANFKPLYKCNTPYRKYVDTVGKTVYLGVRGLRGYFAANPSRFSQQARERIQAIIPITAAELRKRVKLALRDVIGALKVIHAGQYWVYAGSYLGLDLTVTVDYSNPHHQLEYWVTTSNRRSSFWGSSFERLMGLAFANWDNLEQRNADAAIRLLVDHIGYCAMFLSRLPE
jgi:hypothetical protein